MMDTLRLNIMSYFSFLKEMSCFAAPLIRPQINVTVMEGSILVYWREIPEDLQGCITSYKLYLQEQFYPADPKVYGRYTVLLAKI